MDRNDKWNIVVKTSMFVGIATFVTTLLLSLFWHRDGFDDIELVLLSITSSIIFLFFLVFSCSRKF
ncbi:hypothetical protein [Tenacibaculum xiamenense]|uniref:hypothetical protein n=1 Tax=Tenacibaculum xiamenense TaxID=1261553 RepID=UPI003895CE52